MKQLIVHLPTIPPPTALIIYVQFSLKIDLSISHVQDCTDRKIIVKFECKYHCRIRTKWSYTRLNAKICLQLFIWGQSRSRSLILKHREQIRCTKGPAPHSDHLPKLSLMLTEKVLETCLKQVLLIYNPSLVDILDDMFSHLCQDISQTFGYEFLTRTFLIVLLLFMLCLDQASAKKY